MTALKAAVEKLPLTTRKNLRDSYEAKKPEYLSDLKQSLGVEWNIEFNPNLIYAYADADRQSRLGEVMVWYMDAFVSNTKRFAEDYGPDGVAELNAACPTHTLIFGPQEKTKFNYGGLVIQDGALHLVFAVDCLAVNVDDVSKDFAQALKDAASTTGSAPNHAYNLIARNSVRQEYDPKIGEIQAQIAKLVGIPDVKLDPNFDANAQILASAGVDDYDNRIAFLTLAYFQGLAYQLTRHGFANDDMMQEAFQEAVADKAVRVRVFPKWQDDNFRYNEIVVDGGVLSIQTIAEFWGSNTDDAAVKLPDIL